MARPTKQGLDYFPLDVGFLRDSKIRRMMRANAQSIPVLVSLLCTIYRDDGFYMRWTEDQSFLVADELGISEGAVTEIAQKAIQVDFFDSDIFNNYRILTSRGIQKRYFSSTSRKKEVLVPREILLIDVSACNNLVFVDINAVSACNNPQRKVKESKGKKSKENILQSNGNLESETRTLPEKVYHESVCLLGSITPAQYGTLLELVDTYGETNVVEALKIARRANKPNLMYALGVLKNWKRGGRGSHETSTNANEQRRHDGNVPSERTDGRRENFSKYQSITGL